MTDELSSQNAHRTHRPWLLPLITGVVGLFVGGTLVGVMSAAMQSVSSQNAATQAEESKASLLTDALDHCGVEESADAELGDGGMTLTVNDRGEDDFGGLGTDKAWCIVKALKPPAAVTSHIEQTTSMDGRQTESWGDVAISWSYHPDRGFDYILTVGD